MLLVIFVCKLGHVCCQEDRVVTMESILWHVLWFVAKMVLHQTKRLVNITIHRVQQYLVCHKRVLQIVACVTHITVIL